MTPVHERILKLVHEKRVDKGISRTDLIMEVGMTYATLQRIEAGEGDLSLTRIMSFMRALDISWDELVRAIKGET